MELWPSQAENPAAPFIPDHPPHGTQTQHPLNKQSTQGRNCSLDSIKNKDSFTDFARYEWKYILPPQQPRITQRRHELKSKHIKPTGSHLKRQFQACFAGERDSALSECVTSWEPETWSLDHVTLPSATRGDHPSAHLHTDSVSCQPRSRCARQLSSETLRVGGIR